MPRRFIKAAAIATVALAATFSTPKPAEANLGAIFALLKEAASYHIGGFKFIVPWDASAKILKLCTPHPTHCTVTAKPAPPANHHRSSNSVGPWVVGCIGLAAGGLIVASIAKANAMGSPYRWMSQAEFERYEQTRDRRVELTVREAQLIGFTCGIGAVPVIWNYRN